MGFPGDIVRVARGTLAKVTAVNPVLQDGQEFFETDTKKSKHGDGVTAYNALAYDAGASVGSSGLITTPYATAISLDQVGGREMGQQSITTNTVLTVASGAVVNGNCNLTIVRNGTATLDLSAFQVRGDTLTNEATRSFNIAFIQRPDAAYAYVSLGILIVGGGGGGGGGGSNSYADAYVEDGYVN